MWSVVAAEGSFVATFSKSARLCCITTKAAGNFVVALWLVLLVVMVRQRCYLLFKRFEVLGIVGLLNSIAAFSQSRYAGSAKLFILHLA
jgi:hypothetical protein